MPGAGEAEGVASAAEGGALRSLDARAITLWRIEMGLRGLFFIALALALELLLGTPVPTGLVTGLVLALAAAVVVVLPPLRYRAWEFALRDEHLQLRHGVLFRTTSIVPYARIQHVDTRHGPVDRRLGLASLVVFTAGTRGAIVTIPALEAGEAEEMRDRLAALSGAGDAV